MLRGCEGNDVGINEIKEGLGKYQEEEEGKNEGAGEC